jgi:hypothetical protein
MSDATQESPTESGKSSGGGLVEKATGLVPEIAHDLIARALPGAIILVLSANLETFGASSSAASNPFVSAAGWTIAAYAVGILLDFLRAGSHILRNVVSNAFSRSTRQTLGGPRSSI